MYPKKTDIHVSKYPCIQISMISKYPLIQVSKKNQYPRYPSIRISEKSGIHSSLDGPKWSIKKHEVEGPLKDMRFLGPTKDMRF